MRKFLLDGTAQKAGLPETRRSRFRPMLQQSTSDWNQGYCYQLWRCRNNGFRADGKDGQFIVVLPDQNAVVVITANIGDMQAELNLVWEHIFPAL